MAGPALDRSPATVAELRTRPSLLAGHGPGEIAAVFAGGMVGALLRGGLSEAFPHGPAGWPWGTFIANMAGTALLAWLFFHLHHGLPANARRRRLLEPGLCGALTTFSTLQLELVHLINEGAVGMAFGYAATSLAIGLAVAFLGIRLTRARRAATTARIEAAR